MTVAHLHIEEHGTGTRQDSVVTMVNSNYSSAIFLSNMAQRLMITSCELPFPLSFKPAKHPS